MAVRMITAAQVAEMKRLRAKGLAAPAVGTTLGLSASTVRNWWNAGECVDCGGPTERSRRSREGKRCETCLRLWIGSDEGRAARTRWTNERVIEAIVWWAAEHGEPPALLDFSPRHCFDRGDLERGLHAERLIAEGHICWFMTAVHRFGSWNAAILAAGFTPRAPKATPENAARDRRRRRTQAVA
jgi:hypothetical protein